MKNLPPKKIQIKYVGCLKIKFNRYIYIYRVIKKIIHLIKVWFLVVLNKYVFICTKTLLNIGKNQHKSKQRSVVPLIQHLTELDVWRRNVKSPLFFKQLTQSAQSGHHQSGHHMWLKIVEISSGMKINKETWIMITSIFRYQYKRWTLQTSDVANIGPTNVGRYKGRTVQTLDLQISDWYTCRTSTKLGLVQTSP